MKKFKLLALSLSAMFLLTGCGKTLNCTLTKEEDGISIDQEIKVKFKKDEPQKIEMKMVTKLVDDEYEDSWDTYVGILDMMFDEKEEDGFKLTTENNDKKHTYEVEIKIDYEKADDDLIEQYEMEAKDYNDLKEELEEEGYKCK